MTLLQDNLISRALTPFEPTLGGREEEYRQTFLAIDKQRFAKGLILASALGAAFIYNDYLFFGVTRQFWFLFVARSLFIAFVIIFIAISNKLRKPKHYDWAALAIALIGVTIILYIDSTRPPSYTVVSINSLIVIGIYLLSPGNLLFRCLPALVISIGNVFIAYHYRTEHLVSELNLLMVSLVAGNVLGIFVSATLNNSRRKHFITEATLQEAKQEWERTFDTVPDLILILDKNHKVVRANMTTAERLGMSLEEIVGKPCFEIIHGTKAPIPSCPHSLLLADGKEHFAEVVEERVGVVFGVSVSPLHDAEGRLVGCVHIARDITERKRAEEVFQKQHEIQRNLLSAIPAYVYFKDTNSVYIAGNQRFSELSGVPENEIAGKTDYDFFSREDADSIRKDDAEIIAAGKAKLNYEIRMTDKKGNAVWYSTSKSPFYGSSGEVAGLVGICTDTTTVKEAQDALLESERRYRLVVETASDAVYLTDHVGNFTFLNQVALIRSGFTEAELIGQSYLVTIHPDYRAQAADFYASQFRDRIPETYYELPVLPKHGEIIWIGQKVQLLVQGERIVGFQSIARDITDRRKAQVALRESEERFRQLAENVDDIFMLIEPTHPYSLIYVSPAYERVTHSRADDLYKDASAWLELVSEEFRDGVKLMFEGFIGGYKNFDCEFQIVRPSGDIRWIWATGFVIKDSEGKVSRLGMNARDTTNRKSDEERLGHLVNEIKDFAYIISHDCRAPLINVQGFAGELESAMEAVRPAIRIGLPHLNEKQRLQALAALEEDIPEALGFIQTSILRIDGLITSILDLSRLERREFHIERLNMNQLVEETLKSLSYQLEETGAKVHVGDLPQATADRLAMEQVMTNLLINALKFRDPERPQEISITGHRFPEETAFVVRDQGRGIDSVYLSKIFQIFHRGSVRDVPGEGMGLAYVRTLIRRHGGHIWCESNPGSGSTFTFTISNQLQTPEVT